MNNVSLDDVRKFLSKIPDINKGGCGIATLTMLEVLNNDDTKIAFLYPDGFEPMVISNTSAEMFSPSTLIPPAHCAILYKKRFLDCKEELDLAEFKYVQFVDKEELIATINTHQLWNHTFDWKSALPKIKEFTGLDIDVEVK